MSYTFINRELLGQVEVLRLNDPQTMNAISPKMLEELSHELARVEDDQGIRVLIITGEGRGFCSGANIKRMYAQAQGDTSVQLTAHESPMTHMTPHLMHSRKVVYQLTKLSKTVIAAINGPCVTTGVGFAAACDMRIGSNDARIGWLFLRRGLPPEDGSLSLMVRLLGYAKAFKLGIFGETIPAQQALEIGFLDQVVPNDALLPTCLELAQRIIDSVPPLAQRMFKRLLSEAQYLSYEHASLMAYEAEKILKEQSDQKESVQAFMENRQPKWMGT